jgi:crotonobetainyl-CoA:carnitine CoA-transferase CaiB-like acyl-CoA transferase
MSGLSGIRVVEISDTPGACFAASLLADFGARVVVCETLPHGSRVRRLGTQAVRDVWWRTLARNKQSIAVDPDSVGTQDVLRRLYATTDLVVTDVPAPVRGSHPLLRVLDEFADVTVVGVFPTGTDLPRLWTAATRPEMTAAATGTLALTGWPDQAPCQPEAPYAEYMSGVLAALRAVAALRRRRVEGGPSARIEIALHQALQRMVEWQLPIATLTGEPIQRAGNAFPLNVGIGNMHRAKDGGYVAISAASQPVMTRLLEMLGGPALRDDPRYATASERARGLDTLYGIIDRWIGERTVPEILDLALRHDVVIGAVFTTDDMNRSAQMQARGNLSALPAEDGTPIPMPGVVPRIGGLEPRLESVGPALGHDTERVLRDAGFSTERIEALLADGTVASPRR